MSGLTIGDKTLVWETDDFGGGYEWSQFGVFRDGEGRLFTASDSGCSCNYPWEFTEVAPESYDFTPHATVRDVEDAARKWIGNYSESRDLMERELRELRKAVKR